MKVLYIRRTIHGTDGHYWNNISAELSELDTFARWAFGPHGLPMLELLAYGDFTEGYPNSRNNELFCRALKDVEVRRNISSIPLLYQKSELGYNKVPSDLDINAPTAMLGACPTYNNPYRTFVTLLFSSEIVE